MTSFHLHNHCCWQYCSPCSPCFCRSLRKQELFILPSYGVSSKAKPPSQASSSLLFTLHSFIFFWVLWRLWCEKLFKSSTSCLCNHCMCYSESLVEHCPCLHRSNIGLSQHVQDHLFPFTSQQKITAAWSFAVWVNPVNGWHWTFSRATPRLDNQNKLLFASFMIGCTHVGDLIMVQIINKRVHKDAFSFSQANIVFQKFQVRRVFYAL